MTHWSDESKLLILQKAKKMFKLFNCKLRHAHDWELVAVNDMYYTNYTDTGKTKHWQMRFYKCSCGERRAGDNRTNTYSTHAGMQEAKNNWIDAGVVPTKSYHPTENTSYVKIDDLERKELDPVLAYQKTMEELVNSLGVVINRDFDLESRYPKLKEAADEYHRRLEKYKNFESRKV